VIDGETNVWSRKGGYIYSFYIGPISFFIIICLLLVAACWHGDFGKEILLMQVGYLVVEGLLGQDRAMRNEGIGK
jgi:hypothetical protein